MRDAIREKDLEAWAHEPTVDVDDRGVATVVIARDDLDRVLSAAFRRTW